MHQLRKRRDARLPGKLGLDLPGYGPEEPSRGREPGYEYDPDYAPPRGALAGPERVIEDYGDVDFGPFTLAEVWDDVNDVVNLAETLGWGPTAPEITEQETVSSEASAPADARNIPRFQTGKLYNADILHS